MKSTDNGFKQVIEDYIKTVSVIKGIDLSNPEKNIDDCCKYIINTVQKTGRSGFADAEIYSMAITYYTTPGIDPGKDTEVNVVINKPIELTEEEIAAAKAEAIDEIKRKEIQKIADEKKKAAEKKAAEEKKREEELAARAGKQQALF